MKNTMWNGRWGKNVKGGLRGKKLKGTRKKGENCIKRGTSEIASFRVIDSKKFRPFAPPPPTPLPAAATLYVWGKNSLKSGGRRE